MNYEEKYGTTSWVIPTLVSLSVILGFGLGATATHFFLRTSKEELHRIEKINLSYEETMKKIMK